MRRLVVRLLTVAVLLCAAGLAILRAFVLTPQTLQSSLLSTIQKSFTGRVELAGVRLEGLSTIVVTGLKLSSADGLEDFLALEEGRLTIDPTSLLWGEPRLSRAVFDRPRVWLKRDVRGRFTYEGSLGRAPEPAPGGGGQGLATAGETGRSMAIDAIVVRSAQLGYTDATLPVGVTRIDAEGSLGERGLSVESLTGRLYDRFPVSMRGVAVAGDGPGTDLAVEVSEFNPRDLLTHVPSMAWLVTWGEQPSARASLHMSIQSGEQRSTTTFELSLADLEYESPSVLGGTVGATAGRLIVGSVTRAGAGTVDGTLDLEGPTFRPAGFASAMGFARLSGSFEVTEAGLRLRSLRASGEGPRPPAPGGPGPVLEAAGFIALHAGRMAYDLSFEGQDLSAAAALGPMWTLEKVLPGARLRTRGRLVPGALTLRSLAIEAGIRPASATMPTTSAEPVLVLAGRVATAPGTQVSAWSDASFRAKASLDRLLALAGLPTGSITSQGDLDLRGRLAGPVTAPRADGQMMPTEVFVGRPDRPVPLLLTSGRLRYAQGELTLRDVQANMARGVLRLEGETVPGPAPGQGKLVLSGRLVDGDTLALGRALGLGAVVEGRGVLAGTVVLAPGGLEAQLTLELVPSTIYMGGPVPGLTGDGRVGLERLVARIQVRGGRIVFTRISARSPAFTLGGTVSVEADGRVVGTLSVRPLIPAAVAQTLTVSGTRDAPVIAARADGGRER